MKAEALKCIKFPSRLLLRPSFLAIAICCLALPALLQLWRWRQSSSSRDALQSAIEAIALHLRPEQGQLAEIHQHVYSAYFDTRSTLGGRKFVRVITVLDTWAYSSEFICQFMHSSGGLSFSTVARKSKIGAGMEHRRHNYQEHVLSCPITSDLTAAAFLFIQTHDASHRSDVMQVRHNALSLGEKPEHQKAVINCVSVTFGRPNEFRLIEWLEAQRLMKMDKVQLHFYHMQNTRFEAVAQVYSAEGFVDIRRIGCPFCEAGYEETLGLLLMSPAINQCFYENLGHYKYTAVFDLDEIIVPQQHADYPSLMSALEHRMKASSFAFRNWYHFTELGVDTSVPRNMHMLRHPYRTNRITEEGVSAKSIHRSDCVVALHNHYSWEDVPAPGTSIQFYDVPVSLGVNEHYKRCHFDAYQCREMTDARTRRDGSRLQQLVGRELTSAFQGKAKQLLMAKAVN